MDVWYEIDSQGRTIIKASAGAYAGEQKCVVYPPTGASFELYFTWPNGSTESFAIEDEDKVNQFIGAYPNSPSGQVVLARETRSGIAGYYTPWTEKERYTLTYPINKNAWTEPKIDSASYAPTNTILNNASLYAKTKNGVTVSSISSRPQHGASIVKEEWYLSTDTSKRYQAGDSSGVFQTHGQITLNVAVTDTREITTTLSIPITVYDYAPPVALVGGVTRKANGIDIIAGKSCSTVGGYNKCRLEYRLRDINHSNWGDSKVLLDEESSSSDYEGIVSETLNDQVIYYVDIFVTDSFGAVGRVITDLPTDEVYMHRAWVLNSLGLGGYATQQNALQCYWDAYFYGKVTLTSPNGTQYELKVNDDGSLETEMASSTLLLRRR